MAIDSFEKHDAIDSLQTLRTKFLTSDSHRGWRSFRSFFAKFAPDMPPKVKKSIVVWQDLSFAVFEVRKTRSLSHEFMNPP